MQGQQARASVETATCRARESKTCQAGFTSFTLRSFIPEQRKPIRHVFLQDEGVIKDWARRLHGALQGLQDRPRKLLVLINPFGGSREAKHTWEHTVAPIFNHAGAQPLACSSRLLKARLQQKPVS